MMKNVLLLSVAVCALLPIAHAYSEDTITLPEVVATGVAETPDRIILNFEEDTVFPAADGGALLESLPGVSGSRMGSHGIDPFIRGQKQSQINLIDDGVSVHGGCPNRMDPPSSYLQIEGNDQLIVEKGYSSVQNGAGGNGGTIKTTRNAPLFEEGKSVSGSLSGGYDSNGDARDVSLKTAFGFEDGGYVRANAQKKKARSYEDGSGKDVRAGYINHGGRLDVGFSPKLGTDIKVGVQIDSTSDALYAGAAMDAPKADNMALRGYLSQDVDFSIFNKVEASAFMSNVDHIMDNFSLRHNAGAMGMLTESDTQTYGIKLSAKGTYKENSYVIGSDLQMSDQDALRYMGAQTNIYASGNDQAYMWPGMSSDQIGLFVENEYHMTESSRLKVGLRYDYVNVTAGKSNAISSRTGRSASDLYNLYYGDRWEDTSEHNVGGLIRYGYDINKNFTVYGSASRSVRTADVTERAMAADHATASQRWVGNPNIKPEKHHQVELGSNLSYDSWNLGGSVYYNRITDYILRDNARAQDGVRLADNADIYRNVDASLTGFELAGGLELSKGLNLNMNVAYTYGQNREDNRPLAQIAPLEFGSALEYSTQDWMSGLRLHGAAKQNHADVGGSNSGLDIAKTGGYAVFDLYGKVWAFKPFDVAFGVTNVLDKTYANHLNRSSSFDTAVTQVNEPGRSFFVRLNADF
jgi:iron complex outermembrane recepter protein